MNDTSTDGYKTLTLILGQLIHHPAWDRTVLDPEDMAELTLQVYERGLDPTRPIVVAPDGGDVYPVLSGNRRWLALMLAQELHGRANGPATIDDARAVVNVYAESTEDDRMAGYGLMAAYETLKQMYSDVELTVAVFEGNAKAEVLELLSHNYGQSEADPLGKAQAFQAAVEAGASVAEVARRIGKHRRYVENHTGLLQLSDTLRQRIAAGDLSLGIAAPIAKLPAAKRNGMDAFVSQQSAYHVRVDGVKQACRKFKKWPGFQTPLEAKTPRAYHQARILASLWARLVEGNPDLAWSHAAAMMFWPERADIKRYVEALAPDYLTESAYYWEQKPDYPRLLKDFLPGISCAGCPVAQLPADLLHEDLDKAKYPCRQKGGTLHKRCIHAPMDGAPFHVEIPYQWKQAAKLSDYSVTSEEQLQSAYRARQAFEVEVLAANDPVLGEVTANDGPIARQRALIASFLEAHTDLNHGHPLATPCARCRWKLAESPTRDETVPHCEWAGRLRSVEFFVRTPVEGIGTTIPVCRQFKARDEFTWRDRIPAQSPASDLPRAWMLHQVERLARQTHLYRLSGRSHGKRTFLEVLTGRPLVKSEDHAKWFLDMLNREQDDLSNAQVGTLFLWATAEWQARAKHTDGYGRNTPYQLLVGDCDPRPVTYKDVSWEKYWLKAEEENTLADLEDDGVASSQENTED